MSEEWRPVVRYEGIYEVSNLGQVASLKFNKRRLLKQFPDTKGYPIVKLCRNDERTFKVHRLVTSAFIGEIPAGMQVNHKDGNKTNNRADNLEIVTNGENQLHCYRVLGYKRPGRPGEKSPQSKLSEQDVKDIRRMREFGFRPFEIARTYPVGQTAISRICNRERWKHIL